MVTKYKRLAVLKDFFLERGAASMLVGMGALSCLKFMADVSLI